MKNKTDTKYLVHVYLPKYLYFLGISNRSYRGTSQNCKHIPGSVFRVCLLVASVNKSIAMCSCASDIWS